MMEPEQRSDPSQRLQVSLPLGASWCGSRSSMLRSGFGRMAAR